jgi:hypothetical protein
MRTTSASILCSAFSDSIAQRTLDDFLATLSADELTRLHYDFELWARDDQLPPDAAQGGGDWTIWLMLYFLSTPSTKVAAEAWLRRRHVAAGRALSRVRHDAFAGPFTGR